MRPLDRGADRRGAEVHGAEVGRPRNFPIGVRAPDTITERVDGLTVRVYGRRRPAPWLSSGGERLLDHLEDLVADQLVALDERLLEGGVDVTVLRQDLEHAFLLGGQDVLDALLAGVVGRTFATRLAPPIGPCDTASKEISEPAIERPTIWAASCVATIRSLAGPVPDSPSTSSSAARPPSAIAFPEFDLGPAAREPLLLVAVREQAERCGA